MLFIRACCCSRVSIVKASYPGLLVSLFEEEGTLRRASRAESTSRRCSEFWGLSLLAAEPSGARPLVTRGRRGARGSLVPSLTATPQTLKVFQRSVLASVSEPV